MRKLWPVHIPESHGPFAFRKRLMTPLRMGSFNILPGKRGSSGAIGTLRNNSNNTLIGSSRFGWARNWMSWTSPGLAVFAKRMRMVARFPSIENVRSLRLMKTSGWSTCRVNSPSLASPQKPVSKTALVTKSIVLLIVSRSDKSSKSCRVRPTRFVLSFCISFILQPFNKRRMRCRFTLGKGLSWSACHIRKPVRYLAVVFDRTGRRSVVEHHNTKPYIHVFVAGIPSSRFPS